MVAQYMPTISFQVLFCVGKKKQNKLTSACNLWPNGSNVLANQSTCFSIVLSEIKLVYKTFLLLLVSKHASMAYFSGCQWLLVLMTIITNCRLSQDQLSIDPFLIKSTSSFSIKQEFPKLYLWNVWWVLCCSYCNSW